MRLARLSLLGRHVGRRDSAQVRESSPVYPPLKNRRNILVGQALRCCHHLVSYPTSLCATCPPADLTRLPPPPIVRSRDPMPASEAAPRSRPLRATADSDRAAV